MSADPDINTGDAGDLGDDELALLSDYHDDLLSPTQRAMVDEKLKTDARWQLASAELVATQQALSGLQKARAPVNFATDVTETIHKRSGGAFFSKRMFGDRMPFGVLLVIALVVVGILAGLLWSSTTGSASRKHAPHQIEAPSGEPLLQ